MYTPVGYVYSITFQTGGLAREILELQTYLVEKITVTYNR